MCEEDEGNAGRDEKTEREADAAHCTLHALHAARLHSCTIRAGTLVVRGSEESSGELAPYEQVGSILNLVDLSILSIFLSIYLSILLSFFLSIYLSVSRCGCLSVWSNMCVLRRCIYA